MPCFNLYNRPFFAAACTVAALSCRLYAETVDIPTSYHSPSGSYVKLITTGDSGPANTTINSNGGATVLVPPSNPDGKVGIGIANPAKKLDVGGDFSATGSLTSETDVIVGTSSVITKIVCGPGLECSREDNTIKISRARMASCTTRGSYSMYTTTYGCCYPRDNTFAFRNCQSSSKEEVISLDSGPGPVGSLFRTQRILPAFFDTTANLNCREAVVLYECTRR